MTTSRISFSVLCLALLLLAGASPKNQSASDQEQRSTKSDDHVEQQPEKDPLKVQYLEIVTPAVDETCDALAKAHRVVFTKPIAELGNARTADLANGGRIGVRAPMRETETPVVRPYLLVDDIKAAVEVAKDAGAEIALPPMKIPDHGTFAIYILGGIEHGLWQL